MIPFVLNQLREKLKVLPTTTLSNNNNNNNADDDNPFQMSSSSEIISKTQTASEPFLTVVLDGELQTNDKLALRELAKQLGVAILDAHGQYHTFVLFMAMSVSFLHT